MSRLPTEIIDAILLYSNGSDFENIKKMRKWMSEYIYKILRNRANEQILIYGSVQGGKTSEIIKIIKEQDDKIVLIIQNSLLVLEQYKNRFKSEKINFSVVGENFEISSNVFIVINNIHRYNKFKLLNITDYILIMDESDQIKINCPLQGYINYHVTATPFNYPQKYFDRIQILDVHEKYHGLSSVNVILEKNEENIIESIIKNKNRKNMILINKYLYIQDMKICAEKLSKKYKNIPIVFLSENRLYLKGYSSKIKEKSINLIIDSLIKYSNIIFIANRHANRGLSFCSSNYSRHLTHQIITVKKDTTNFIQSMRILGIYSDSPNLNVYVDSLDQWDIKKNKILNFDPLLLHK